MMRPCAFAVYVVLAMVAYRTTTVSALAMGAPICAFATLGTSAVRGAHTSATTRNITAGSMADGGFTVVIGTTTLSATTVTTLDTLRDYSVTIRSATGRSFRGAHVLLASTPGTNLTDALLPQAPYQRSPACNATGIAGVSHVEASLKTQVTALLRVATPAATLTLDVNLVVSNTNVTGSVHYFTQYKLAAVVATKSPTKTPTKAPVAATKAPVAATKAPTKTATKAPVAAPKAPVTAPTVPVAAPVTAPTSTSCGLLGLSIFCPIKRCGILGRLLGLCQS